jgi:hypothetical protein
VRSVLAVPAQLGLDGVADVLLGDLAALGAGRRDGVEEDGLLDRGHVLVLDRKLATLAALEPQLIKRRGLCRLLRHIFWPRCGSLADAQLLPDPPLAAGDHPGEAVVRLEQAVVLVAVDPERSASAWSRISRTVSRSRASVSFCWRR